MNGITQLLAAYFAAALVLGTVVGEIIYRLSYRQARKAWALAALPGPSQVWRTPRRKRAARTVDAIPF